MVGGEGREGKGGSREGGRGREERKNTANLGTGSRTRWVQLKQNVYQSDSTHSQCYLLE